MPAEQNAASRQVKPARTELFVAGMNCSSCARAVTEALEHVPGVASALVSLEAQHASVRWAAGTEADVAAVVQAVRVAGYEARAIEGQSGSPTTDAHARQGIWSYNFWFGMVPTALLL